MQQNLSDLWPNRQGKCPKSHENNLKWWEVQNSCCCQSLRHIAIAGAFNFETYFESWKFSARWIPHKLTDDKKRVRVQTAKQLLEMFLRFKDNFQIFFLVTWVHFFEPLRTRNPWATPLYWTTILVSCIILFQFFFLHFPFIFQCYTFNPIWGSQF